MRIVLVEDVPHVGGAGDIANVADGYARNYLIPRGLAVLATQEEVHRAESRRKTAAERRQKILADMSQVAQVLEGQVVAVRARVGPTGRLYGSVTAQAIAEAVARLAGREIDSRMVELEAPLREQGEHSIRLRLAPETITTLTVRVEAEGAAPSVPAPEVSGQPEAVAEPGAEAEADVAGEAALEDEEREASQEENS